MLGIYDDLAPLAEIECQSCVMRVPAEESRRQPGLTATLAGEEIKERRFEDVVENYVYGDPPAVSESGPDPKQRVRERRSRERQGRGPR